MEGIPINSFLDKELKEATAIAIGKSDRELGMRIGVIETFLSDS
jgi:hypothetical protein